MLHHCRTILSLAMALAAIGCMGSTPGEPVSVEAALEDCMGPFDVSDTDAPLSATVDGTRLILRGVYMSDSTPAWVDVLDANPEVRTIVLANVGGSDVSMDENLDGARMVRERGLATCVPDGGLVASGGSDFLLGGAVRVVLGSGRVGVHSWADDGPAGMRLGSEVPRGDPLHAPFLQFYADMGIPEEFYWFTLEAAPPEGMHWMTEMERQTYRVVTN